MQRDSAETLAIQALGWLATNEELLPIFLGATGSSTDDLRSRAQDPDFLVSLLDFLTMNDDWVVEFCDANGLGYDQPLLARYALPGGAQVNWT
ncbi:MAG: DUF3572 domain-containing protein [Paracoccaceae bacterium]